MTSSPSSAELMRLEELAKKATPGPWEAYRQDEDSGAIYFALHSHQQYEFITNFNDGRARANAHYIAACSPEVILALVRVARCAQAVIDSGHNGNLYAKEYDALAESLQALK